MEPQQLSWVASALFNVGLDLHAARCYAAAVPALQAAAAVGLQALAKGPVPVEVGWDTWQAGAGSAVVAACNSMFGRARH